ncbi:tRNA pseudouridine(55) synthase TruB [Niallia nealsonii]|uniref:tRNA pseudouridine synthase B n=1 Tax=Niallia nealsonii TaxID=115979 RepID=A0A2N0Z5U4_9BACI|nr:tRNA pseudouridine(55) synthase TruB [Niallia nealsonii]PKG24896.1 tRNA pseudouridine(55) synthase TruB [Niallia nealsonii]
MEGILPLWKPKGMTSHDCVFKLRKILHMKRIGHTGTLDPEVDGVLPICLGRATKVAEYITDAGKTYEGEVTIGFSTTTEDASGEVVNQKEVTQTITRAMVEDVLKTLTGPIKQTPPMYSAVKVNGKRLYEYARQGIEVERPTREVTIYSLNLLDDWEELVGETISFRFIVDCSKGTYIRTLAVMIGEMLGYPAHMSKLTRTRSATMTKKDCLTIEEVAEKQQSGTIEKDLRPLEDALCDLPKFQINDTLAMKVRNGMVLELPFELKGVEGPIVMESEEGEALAIYVHHPTKIGKIKPSKILKVL